MHRMLSGYNHNIPYKNRIFHLQTEDGGTAAGVLTSTLFLEGAVVASRRTPYPAGAGRSPSREEIREMMEKQHRELARELRAGRYDEEIGRLLSRTGGG